MITPFQAFLYAVLGVPVNCVTNPQKDFDADSQQMVIDSTIDKYRACYIRIENLGTEKIYYSEDISDVNGAGICDTDPSHFTGIIAPASAADAGDGGFREWQRHRPSKIYIYGVNAYRAAITLRYAQET